MKDFGLSVNQVIRYGFGGLLLFLLMAIIEPAWTWEKVQILGPVFVPFIALGIGLLIYVFYRPILGYSILWPLYDEIHRRLEHIWGYRREKPNTHNCKKMYLIDKYNVLPGNAIDAYRIIRNDKHIFNKAIADNFLTQHSEIHLLYITCHYRPNVAFGDCRK